MLHSGRWFVVSGTECRRINDLLRQQQAAREKAHDHYVRTCNSSAPSLPRKSYEPLVPLIVFDCVTNQYYQCPAGDWWEHQSEMPYAFLLWLTPEREQQVLQILQQASRKREAAKQRYVASHPNRRAHCPTLRTV